MEKQNGLEAGLEELRGGLGQAVDSARAMLALVQNAIRGLGPVPVKEIEDDYEQATAAKNGLERTIRMILEAEASCMDNPIDGLATIDWPAKTGSLLCRPHDRER